VLEKRESWKDTLEKEEQVRGFNEEVLG